MKPHATSFEWDCLLFLPVFKLISCKSIYRKGKRKQMVNFLSAQGSTKLFNFHIYDFIHFYIRMITICFNEFPTNISATLFPTLKSFSPCEICCFQFYFFVPSFFFLHPYERRTLFPFRHFYRQIDTSMCFCILCIEQYISQRLLR